MMLRLKSGAAEINELDAVGTLGINEKNIFWF